CFKWWPAHSWCSAAETLHAPGWAGVTLLPPLPAALCPALQLSPSLCPSRSSVGCDQGPQDPVYLPAALELLDAPEHFRVQQVGRYPPANSSLGSRSETFLLLQPWPRAQPLLRASYPPFATQQVVPPRVAEPPHRPVPWDVRAVSVEVAVTPAPGAPQYQEVPLDEAVTLRVPDVPVRPGQLFSATLLLRHNFTASVLTLRIKVKKGLHVMAARPAQPTLWTSKLDRFKGSKHHTTLITCHRAGPTGPDASSPRELSEFLWVDFLVDNGTSGGLAVTRPVTWQLEYPGQAPEAEKDKMVWEIPVSERDIRALVPLAKAEELVNTAPLTGVPRRVPVRLVTVDSGGALVEVTEHIGCESANAQVLQVSAACDAVFVTGKESRGARGVRVDFWWRRLRASLWLTVWAPRLPLRIQLTDTTLGLALEQGGLRGAACAGVGSRHLTPLWGCWGRRGQRLPVYVDPTAGPCHPQVRSPLSDSILGEQALAVTDDKVSVLELWVQPVMGLSLALSRGAAHPGEVTATCWAQSGLPAPKQEVALSLWLSFSDHTLAPAELYPHQDLRTEEAGQGEEEEGEAEAREEEGEEEEMVPAPRRVTNLELGMYALLGIFCLAILIFLVNGVVFVLRYQRKEPPDSTPDPASPQPHNWVWLGTDQEDL
ncbi:PREDICTED: transmembrane protein 132A, partial [Myotis davidii]|uniref:transmembrane protein 132A n=1 Tax=Myotis davidii TaxID=225400 RepID=UPI0007677135